MPLFDLQKDDPMKKCRFSMNRAYECGPPARFAEQLIPEARDQSRPGTIYELSRVHGCTRALSE
jgi:hypothetical protein